MIATPVATTADSRIRVLLTTEWYRTLSQTYSGILDATHSFFREEGISPTIYPITTGSVSSPMGRGSDSVPIKIDIRGNEIYLADSMQFSLEIGARLADRGVYYVMPTFRGEVMDARHLNEFFHCEAEIHGDLKDVMGLVRRYVLFLAAALRKSLGDAILKTAGTLNHVDSLLQHPDRHFCEIDYKDALVDLAEVSGAIASTGTDFHVITAVGEAELIRRHGEFTWLKHMPWQNVPFYQAAKHGTDYSMTADLLAGIGEIVGCGQRILSAEDFDRSLASHEVALHGYGWYREMREIRKIQTAGFGLGIERFILWLMKKQDIRDCMILIRNHNFVSYP
jgi:asparaginyl-tRNA synthetase